MRIEITAQNMVLTDALRELVHTRLHYALGRLARRIAALQVSFEDVHGPRGGVDVECRIQVRLRPGGAVNVSATRDHPGAALGEAAQRAARCVKSRLRRRWMLRRRPQAVLTGGSAV
jgi:ribosome-associated translation inhibitor RaiA